MFNFPQPLVPDCQKLFKIYEVVIDVLLMLKTLLYQEGTVDLLTCAPTWSEASLFCWQFLGIGADAILYYFQHDFCFCG